MKKILFILLFTLLVGSNSIAYAGQTRDIDGNIILTDDSYTADGKIKTFHTKYGNDNLIINAEIWKLDKVIPKIIFYGADDKKIEGTISYPNYSDMKVGNFDLQWVFTPSSSEIYETISGVFHFYLFPSDTEVSKGKIITEEYIEPTTLTASTLLLTTLDSTYDINLVNKTESEAVYTWLSSNTKIAKVNSKGVVSSVSEGKAAITCKVVTSDETQLLTTNVIVSNDDNAIQLTETDLNLEVGEVFDIDVENTISKAKYKWSTSDKTVAKITTTTGKVTALKIGSATITCTITTSDKKVYVLQSQVTVE